MIDTSMGTNKLWVARCLVLFAIVEVQSNDVVYVIDIKGNIYTVYINLSYVCITIVESARYFFCDLADLPPEQQLATSVLVGLLNRNANSPSAIGKINPTDDAWILSAQTEEPSLQNATFQPVATLEDLGIIAKGSGLQHEFDLDYKLIWTS